MKGAVPARTDRQAGSPDISQVSEHVYPEKVQQVHKMVSYGTRAEVWQGEADKTRGGLKKDDLMLNRRGKLVSKKRSAMAQKNIGRLREYQYKKKEDGKRVVRARKSVPKKASETELRASSKAS